LLGPEELARYRAAGRDATDAFVASLERLRPDWRELDATAELAGRLHARGFTTPVLLAGGEARAPVTGTQFRPLSDSAALRSSP
jgi:Xaa-Pro aminopeptidase